MTNIPKIIVHKAIEDWVDQVHDNNRPQITQKNNENEKEK